MSTAEWTPEENAHLLSELRWLYGNHPNRLNRSDRIMLAALAEAESGLHAEQRVVAAFRVLLEQAKLERDTLIGHFLADDCPIERGFDAPGWCQSEEQCGDWSCDFGVEDCWRKWAAYEAAKEES